MALFPATIELALCAILFALVLGIPAGILAAVKRNSVLDHGVMGVSLTGYSMPIFWWGLLLILLFSVQLDLTPVSGRIAFAHFIEPVTGFLLLDTLLAGNKAAFWSAATHLILPTIVLGIPAGILAAVKRNSVLDHGVMGVSLTGYSMPIFWWGLLLILLFSVQLDLTPVSGRIAFAHFIEPVTGFLLLDTLLAGNKAAFWSAATHLILPTIVLGTNPLAVIARMTRSAMLEVLGEDYIRTARAKGLSNLRVVALHALRNALIPVVTVIGLQVGVLFTGAILTETIFSWPGVGKWMIEAIGRRDYPVLQGGMLLLGIIVMAVNLLVDVTYGVINPKVRH